MVIDVQGESNESAKTGGSIARNVLLGMIGVYMLLALQVPRLPRAGCGNVGDPTALIGVIFGHMALASRPHCRAWSVAASLFGVVVNDSILLVVFIRDERANGVPVQQAAAPGPPLRVSPDPADLDHATSRARCRCCWKEPAGTDPDPLAASLAFGLMAATVIALFLVPSIYCILDD